jgi:hypothetical protein
MQRRDALVLVFVISVAGVGLGVANHACYELVRIADERGSNKFFVATVFDDCVTDDDCVLMPSLVTCCGECEPSPPFRAAPRSDLTDLRSDCLRREQLCDPPVCTAKPAGCEARAVCRSGTCAVISHACEGR